MDRCNEYMVKYRAPPSLRNQVRMFLIHCRGLKKELGFETVIASAAPSLNLSCDSRSSSQHMFGVRN
jgi:hypothetical protein